MSTPMSYLIKRKRKGKIEYFIIWFDWRKGKGNKGRREIACSSYGYHSKAQCEKLLKKIKQQEEEIKASNQGFTDVVAIDRLETEIKLLIVDYIKHRRELVEARFESINNNKKVKTLSRVGLSEKTLIDDINSLRIFKEFCEFAHILYCKDFTPEQAQAFRSWLEKQGRETRTNSKIMQNIKSFLRKYELARPPYFVELNIILKLLKPFPRKHSIPRVFTVEELRKIINSAREHDCRQCEITRNSKNQGKNFGGVMPLKFHPLLPLVLLLMFTGARRKEALNLRWTDIDLKKGVFTIYAEKTGRPRLLNILNDPSGKISPTFLEILRIWKLKSQGSEFVLPSMRAEEPVFPKYCWNRYKKIAEVKENTPQSYRSNFVSYALSWGVPIPALSSWTGHGLDVIQKHYYSYVTERLMGDSLEEIMGVSDLLVEILQDYRGEGNLSLTKWA